MKILVIGAGGREHALAWKLAQSPRVFKVFVAPGNAGTAAEEGVSNVPHTSTGALIDFVKTEGVALTVVGPEAPLAAGVVDAFQSAGLRIFGPTRRAAQLESSKDFAKSFMIRHRIPTAAYATFTDAASAHEYIDRQGAPIVVKADGLAAGKGVVVAASVVEAHAAVDMMLVENRVGAAGARVVIEECLEGEEASFIVLADGRHALPLASSQDHKRLLDADRGPNTGGMGAYSPAPIITPALHARIMRDVIDPAISGMRTDGSPYTGFLYAGLMIGRGGELKVLEFNCRMGDPETQPILVRLKTDLVQLIEHALDGTLDQAEAEWDPRVALGIVLAAGGYPETPRKGDVIEGLPEAGDDYRVFHAGTALDGNRVLTSGGRVLCVTALGHNVRTAQSRAYDIVSRIRFDGMQYRRDIGHRALEARSGRAARAGQVTQGRSVQLSEVEAFLRSLQDAIVTRLTALDGRAFRRDAWQRSEGGGGVTSILEEGALFERAGVGYSHVHGPNLPPAASAARPELAGRSFQAMGVSLVLHPRNPFVPTVHMNVRCIAAEKSGTEPVWWFGGGMDLTPYYPWTEDVVHFHRTCRDALAPFGEERYPRYKRWCDEYFYIRHRNEPRGVGGIFFDDVNEPDFETCFALMRSVGGHFLPAYVPIVERRRAQVYGERERDFQAYHRGRYVEFNLVYDRGTLFGLQSGGRAESILMSLPPLVHWRYDWQPEAGSAEARLYSDFLVAKDWL